MARRGRGGGRGAARGASTSMRTPTPHLIDISDEEMQDAPQSGQVTPQDEEVEEQEEDLAEEDDEEGPTTPANDSEIPSRNSTPARGQSSIPRKRRAGRPPKVRPHDWDAPDENESRDGTSDRGTPKKRGGWRGRGFGGGRWGKARGGPSHVSQVPLDKEGNMANVKDDEVELPEDSEGETKVTKMGVLQGGREYRVRVFTIQGKGDRLYMLSTEPARCIGFRDSYLFFQKHPQLFKIILPEEAKRDLIERHIIPHSYKGRAIGVVTARSVYREFGARIIIGGKRIIDDYQVAVARANGDVEGELAVPSDQVPTTGTGYDKNRYVAWHGASSVYHSGVPTIPIPNGKAGDGKKRKVHVTGANWMFEHAREASRFNSALAAHRRQNLDGVYEPHTNMIHYPKIMQPTHARWEQQPTAGHITDLLAPTEEETVDTCRNIIVPQLGFVDISDDGNPTATIFPKLAPGIARNFMVTDTSYEGPPISGMGIPGPDGDLMDIGPLGLADVTEEVFAALPEECMAAFLEVRAVETEWKQKWRAEQEDHARAELKISYSGIP